MSIHFRYRHLADDRWLELISSTDTRPDWLSRLTARLRDGVGGGVRMPTLPGEQTQTNFVGSSGSKPLREGFEFYRFIKSHCPGSWAGQSCRARASSTLAAAGVESFGFFSRMWNRGT